MYVEWNPVDRMEVCSTVVVVVGVAEIANSLDSCSSGDFYCSRWVIEL
jgi:hypothetical protein